MHANKAAALLNFLNYNSHLTFKWIIKDRIMVQMMLNSFIVIFTEYNKPYHVQLSVCHHLHRCVVTHIWLLLCAELLEGPHTEPAYEEHHLSSSLPLSHQL